MNTMITEAALELSLQGRFSLCGGLVVGLWWVWRPSTARLTCGFVLLWWVWWIFPASSPIEGAIRVCRARFLTPVRGEPEKPTTPTTHRPKVASDLGFCVWWILEKPTTNPPQPTTPGAQSV